MKGGSWDISLVEAAEIKRGVTAVIGSGGKTSLIAALALALSLHSGVIITTSTHVRDFPGVKTTDGRDEAAVRAELQKNRVVLIGEREYSGKLTEPVMPYSRMRALADYVLVEADGARGKPLKAHASYEPNIPADADDVIAVIGADGFGKSVADAAHRPELYAAALGTDGRHTVTPEDAAYLTRSHFSGKLIINKCDGEAQTALARRFAHAYSGRTAAISIAEREVRFVERPRPLIAVRGAGDIASGIAARFLSAGCMVVMADCERPTAIRRTVAFSEAVRLGECSVGGITARLASSSADALAIAASSDIAVLVDPDGSALRRLRPAALVDAILAKRNTGTCISDADTVIGVGPGFTAGIDCHAAVETKRGHDLGRVYYEGSPIPNTGVPGMVGGKSFERLIRAASDGEFIPRAEIGDMVNEGDVVASSGGTPIYALTSGVVRGMLPGGYEVHAGMKCGDIDPRGEREYCFTISDKARAVGGGALEAAEHFMKLSNK